MNLRICIVMIAILCMFSMLACSDGEQVKDEPETDSTKVADVKTEAPAVDVETDSLVPIRPKIRDENNPIVTLSTDMGDMTLELYRDVAPAHVDSFVARTNDGFYDGLIFHRVWTNFIIQGGDPLGTGRGNAGYFLPAEFSDLPHIEGTLSMAHGREPNSASSQFFICLARTAAAEGLDGKYTVFGHLLKGYEALHAIGNVACAADPSNPRENTKPIKDVHITKAFMSDAAGNPL